MDNPNQQSTGQNKMSAEVSKEERELLNESFDGSNSRDDKNLKRSELDNTDNDGTPLNEGSMASDVSGEDLDVPGSEADDANEAIGEEDEENNSYSQADTD